MRRRCAFTLIEILIVVVILGILAAIVIPLFASTGLSARREVTASNVRAVRTLVIAHGGTGDVPRSPGGYPLALNPDWFKGTGPPLHGWTGQSMLVTVVSDAANIVYPAAKVFDESDPAAMNAWYNNTNGAFCALIPAQADDAKTLDLFNDVNNANATTLNQTTY